MSRKSLPYALLALAGLFGMVTHSTAQADEAYPTRPIKFIIPASAGGLPDTVARIVGRRLQERTGQAVIVENRPGGNASLAASVVANAPADGYTFMVQDGSVVSINPFIHANLSYAPNDLLPVSAIARAPLFLAVHPKVPVRTMREFVDYARAHPGQLNYASSGIGSTHHLTMEAIKTALKLDIAHVPYKGTGESVPALLGGHVDAAFSAYPSLSGAVADKRVLLLATNAVHPSALAPDVRPLADIIPDFDFAPTIGVYARSGTPPAAVEKIATEIAAIVKEPDVIRLFTAAGIDPLGGGADDFARALKSETERVAKVVQTAGIKAQ